MINKKWIKRRKWYRIQVGITVNGDDYHSWYWGADVDGELVEAFRKLITKEKIDEALKKALRK